MNPIIVVVPNQAAHPQQPNINQPLTTIPAPNSIQSAGPTPIAHPPRVGNWEIDDEGDLVDSQYVMCSKGKRNFWGKLKCKWGQME